MAIASLLPDGFDLDNEPEIPADTAPLGCTAPGCTNGVVKPARGRTPLFCPEHKTTRAKNTSKSKLSNKSWSRAAEIEELLNTMLGYATIPIAMFNVVDAGIVGTKAPEVVHQLVELAKDDKNLQRALEAIATPGKYGPLSMSIIGLMFPILVNHKIIPDFAGMFDTLGGE